MTTQPTNHHCTEHPGHENHCASGSCGACWLCKERPTNHRIVANDWLEHATTVTSHDEAMLEALVGIGHALLALTQKPPMEPPAEALVEDAEIHDDADTIEQPRYIAGGHAIGPIPPIHYGHPGGRYLGRDPEGTTAGWSATAESLGHRYGQHADEAAQRANALLRDDR